MGAERAKLIRPGGGHGCVRLVPLGRQRRIVHDRQEIARGDRVAFDDRH